ncbi:hypothetical protein QBE55_12235 [Eubacteriales bacterium mix99]|jgi:hypothetical protein|nr:hypothetical protein [Oscillospiraceae bacterium]
MKNRRIIDSWNKIEPDSTADERMLSAILARNHSGKSERKKVYHMNKTLKRLAPIAACFVVVVAIVGVFGNNAGWFGGKTLVSDLGDSGTLNFYKADSVGGAASFSWNADWGDHIDRDLTADKSKVLFGELNATGYATFRSTDNALVHFEGKTGETKIILSATDTPVTDTVVKGNEEVSEINGIPVKAGYFVTDANSKDIKNIICFADFDVPGATIYVERGGAESDSEVLCDEIGGVVEQLTKSPPDITQITAD